MKLEKGGVFPYWRRGRNNIKANGWKFKHYLQQCKQYNLLGNTGSGRNVHLQQCGKYSEGSHIIGKVEGRQRKTGTDEKVLESTGRASNEYFAEKYKDDNTPVSIQSDGKDYSNVDFGKYMEDSLEDICFISITWGMLGRK